MKKIKLNSKVRKLNSLVELVGQEVSVDNENEIIQSEVESIKVTNDEVTLNLESGDQVVMDTEEAEELTETGEVATEVPTEPQDFEVTREVLDEDGNVDTVTSIVEAPTEDEAIQTIQTLDSKRKRNSRNYKAKNSKQVNAKIKPFTIYIGEDEFKINDAESQGNCEYIGSNSFGDISEDPHVCKALCEGNVKSLRWDNMVDYENGELPSIQYNHRLNSRKSNSKFDELPESTKGKLTITDELPYGMNKYTFKDVTKQEVKSLMDKITVTGNPIRVSGDEGNYSFSLGYIGSVPESSISSIKNKLVEHKVHEDSGWKKVTNSRVSNMKKDEFFNNFDNGEKVTASEFDKVPDDTKVYVVYSGLGRTLKVEVEKASEFKGNWTQTAIKKFGKDYYISQGPFARLMDSRKQNQMPEGKEFKMAIGDDYIARFTTCPMGTLLKLEIKKADETNDKFVEVETSWIGKELSMNDAFTAAEEAIEKFSK